MQPKTETLLISITSILKSLRVPDSMFTHHEEAKLGERVFPIYMSRAEYEMLAALTKAVDALELESPHAEQ